MTNCETCEYWLADECPYWYFRITTIMGEQFSCSKYKPKLQEENRRAYEARRTEQHEIARRNDDFAEEHPDFG